MMGVPALVAGLKNELYLTKQLMEKTGFWCVDVNLEKLKVTLMQPTEGPVKSPLSVHLSVFPCASSTFFSGMGH